MEAGWLGLALLGQGEITGASLPMVLQQLPERTALCFQGPQQGEWKLHGLWRQSQNFLKEIWSKKTYKGWGSRVHLLIRRVVGTSQVA